LSLAESSSSTSVDNASVSTAVEPVAGDEKAGAGLVEDDGKATDTGISGEEDTASVPVRGSPQASAVSKPPVSPPPPSRSGSGLSNRGFREVIDADTVDHESGAAATEVAGDKVVNVDQNEEEQKGGNGDAPALPPKDAAF
jgi:hypothetical protein